MVRTESMRADPSRGPSRRTVPGTTAIALEHVPGLGRQPDDGAHRHDALEGGVELDRQGAWLHVLHVHVDAAGKLELARATSTRTWSAAVVSGR